MANFDIIMPKMGESIEEATITNWFVKEGQKLSEVFQDGKSYRYALVHLGGRDEQELVERYAMRGNWRGYTYNDEMQSTALLQLSEVGLKFNEARSQNPFAYYTATITNSFTRVLNLEKRNVSGYRHQPGANHHDVPGCSP